MKPFSPAEARAAREKVFPDFVIEAFNTLIAKNLSGGESTVVQNDVINEILKRGLEGLTRQQIFDNRYLDVEDIYTKQGWKVEYDKPGWDESYPAQFIFRMY